MSTRTLLPVPAGPPLAVWACGQRSLAAQLAGRYLPTTACQPDLLTPEVARHLVEAFTRPGDLVIDPLAGPGILLTEAAAAGRRAAGLITGDRDVDLARANLVKALTAGQLRYAAIRRGAEQHPGVFLDQHHGQAALVATRLPAPAPAAGGDPAVSCWLGSLRGPAYETALGRMLEGWAVLARPGGTVAVVTTSPVAGGVLTDLPGLVIRLAARAGLGYTQHVIAITALIRDSRLFPYRADGVSAPLGTPHDHLDVLVFTRLRPAGEEAR